MIVPDVNLLLYAYDSDSPFHKRAVEWWQDCLSGAEPIGLATVVLFGFVRIGTNPRVFQNPMSVATAAGHIRSWMLQPVTQVLDSSADHADRALRLLETLGTAGNLVTDAQIAALALDHGAVVHTADADFIRFHGLRWLNPITGVRSGRAVE
jgi:toxin-antitoxin system PIN domain toxin